jgi:hypothetical protein
MFIRERGCIKHRLHFVYLLDFIHAAEEQIHHDISRFHLLLLPFQDSSARIVLQTTLARMNIQAFKCTHLIQSTKGNPTPKRRSINTTLQSSPD